MKFVDYYKTLGVSRDAKPDEISRAFRKLARQYHPDVNKSPEAEARFKEINEAHEVLKDPEKRKRYDMLGANYKSGDSFRPPPGFESFSFRTGPGAGFGGASFGGADFSDFFNSLFGGLGGGGGAGGGFGFQDFAGAQPGRGRAMRGADIEAEITVSLEDVFAGAQRTVTLEAPDSGERKTFTFTIPKGVEGGKKIRLAGQGGNGAGAPGDLLITLQIAPHPVFTRTGSDLERDLEVSPWEAALGATLQVASLDGTLETRLPPGTSSGRRLRIKGHGMPRKDGPRGDLYLRVKIVVPEQLSDAERELFESLARTSRFVPRSR